MQTQRIKFVKSLGIRDTLDLNVNHSDHNFYAEGIVTSNSHAVAYASLSAITIYLKFKYPQHFFLSLLKMTRHEPDPISEISKIEKELSSFNIRLLPPHLIKSQDDFSIEGNDIRFGLTSIKGISEKTIENVNKFRKEFKTKFDIFESSEAAGLNINTLCALIQAGCLEGFKQSRSKIVYEAQLWNKLSKKEKVHAISLGESFDYDLVKIVGHLCKTVDAKGKLYIKDSRLNTIRKNCLPYKEIYEVNSKSEKFANWYYENSLIGYSVNNKLRDVFAEKRSDLQLIKDINDLPEKYDVEFIGVVKECKSGVSREKKNKYYKMLVSDETAAITTMIFSKKLLEMEGLNGRLPEEKDIVIVLGQKFGDAVFADTVAIQTHKVYTKFSQLKADKKDS